MKVKFEELYRDFAIVFEVQESIKLLKKGLCEIQKLSLNNDFYTPVFMLLSSGLERLFKIMLCLNFTDKNNRFPNSDEIWKNKNGHDLLFLKSEVGKICKPIDRQFTATDYYVITEEESITKICEILSDYGKKGRYFNIDAILGNEQPFEPYVQWQRLVEAPIGIEMYGEEGYYSRITNGNAQQSAEIINEINEEILVRLEVFFRALCRQFTFRTFSEDSFRFTAYTGFFGDLRDEKLGTTDYSKI